MEMYAVYHGDWLMRASLQSLTLSRATFDLLFSRLSCFFVQCQLVIQKQEFIPVTIMKKTRTI